MARMWESGGRRVAGGAGRSEPVAPAPKAKFNGLAGGGSKISTDRTRGDVPGNRKSETERITGARLRELAKQRIARRTGAKEEDAFIPRPKGSKKSQEVINSRVDKNMDIAKSKYNRKQYGAPSWYVTQTGKRSLDLKKNPGLGSAERMERINQFPTGPEYIKKK